MRSMAEDCQGFNVRLEDRNVGNSEFPNDIRLWGRIRLASQGQDNTVVRSRGRRLIGAYFNTSYTLAFSTPDWTTLDIDDPTFDTAAQESGQHRLSCMKTAFRVFGLGCHVTQTACI